MLVKQISVFVENKKGRLHELTEVLGKSGIDLVTLQIADTKEYGILRAITTNNELAVKVLKENNYTVSVTELVGVEVEEKPGSLCELLQIFDDNEISIEYLYSFSREKNMNAVILFRVDNTEKTLDLISKHNYKSVDESIYL